MIKAIAAAALAAGVAAAGAVPDAGDAPGAGDWGAMEAPAGDDAGMPYGGGPEELYGVWPGSHHEAAAVSLLQYYDSNNQLRAAYGGRRRMVPYGGFANSDNPFRRPNAVRSDGGTDFFTPKWAAGAGAGPDPGFDPLSGVPLSRPPETRQAYGTESYHGPFTYYSPPPAINTAAPAAASSASGSAAAEGGDGGL